MKKTQKLSNSFLVYSVVFFSMLIYIFGIFAVVHFVTEASQISLFEAFSENIISIIIGIICLFLAAPSYRLTKSLRILEIMDHKNGPSILSVYTPFFISDILQIDSKIPLQNIRKIKQNNYYSRLIELQFDENGTDRNIKSFINSKSLARIKNT